MAGKKSAGTSVFDLLIFKGESLRRKAKVFTERSKPLDELVQEKEFFMDVQRYLNPNQYYVAEHLNMTQRDPDYTVHHHPDYPKSSFLKGHIQDFYHAKNVLELSVEKGTHYDSWKRQLLEKLEEYEEKYISGKNPVVLDNVTTINQQQAHTRKLLKLSQRIVDGYESREAKLREPYVKARNEMLGQLAVSGGVTAGLGFVIGRIVAGLHIGSKVAETAIREGAKKIVGRSL